MNKNTIIWVGAALAMHAGSVSANWVTKLDLQDMIGFSDAPVVKVYSSDGEKWDKVDKDYTTSFRLGFDADCRWDLKNDKAYQGYFEVNGFELSGNVSPGDRGSSIKGADHIEADLRWTGKKTAFNPVQVCNAELDKRLSTQTGKNKYELLSQGFNINYQAAVKARYVLFCFGTLGKSDIADNPGWVNVKVNCMPSAKAKQKNTPKPAPKPKKTNLVPAVKSLKLSLNPTRYTGKCPSSVKVDASVSLNYPAEIKYQYIGDRGHKSPVFTLKNKGKAGNWNLAPWSRNIKAPNTMGNLSAGAAKSDYIHNGWMKIRVLSPKPMTSKAVPFQFRCQRNPAKGPGALQTPKAIPTRRPPMRPGLQPGGSQKQPAIKRKPPAAAVTGAKTKKDDNRKTVSPIMIRKSTAQ